MALKLEQKKTIVASVAEMANRSSSLIVVKNNGLPVSDMTRLRAKAREVDVYLRVARNTLVERALKGSPFECMNESLVGPVLLVFGGDELSAGARLIQEFSKTNDKLVVKSLDAKQLALVASLPTRSEAIAKLLAVMQAPIAKFVQTLAAPTSKFVRTLAAVRDQKQ